MTDAAPTAAPTSPANGAALPPAPDATTPAPDAAAAKEGQMLAQLRAKEVALVQKQQADARARAEFENYKKQSQAEIDRARQFNEKLKADPLAVLRELGWSDDAVAARIVSGGKPTAIEEQDKIRAELTELRGWKEQQVAERQKAQQQAALEAAQAAFHATAKAGADKWPLASKVKESRLKSRGLEIAVEHARQGVTLTDEEVLDKLEEELSDFVPKAASSVSASESSKSPTEEPPGHVTQPAPTLTNRAASATAEIPKVDVLKMSPQELQEHTLRVLKDLRAKGLISG